MRWKQGVELGGSCSDPGEIWLGLGQRGSVEGDGKWFHPRHITEGEPAELDLGVKGSGESG